ncbi:hypothetical protein BKA80DRAFT_275905 [Phyllosticta citrichinensis]
MAPLMTIDIPREYGYVLLTATGSLFLSTWHAVRVGPFRKAAGVKYPAQYASNEQIRAESNVNKQQAMHLFNCAQRAHYNFIENHTSFLTALFVAGVKYPVASSIMGAFWGVGRVLYATGYTRKDKEDGKGRLLGFWASLLQLGLMGMAAKVGYDVVTA